MFKNREEAAELLAQKLLAYKGKRPLVLAIPRGAVGMARLIADTLGGDLDVVLVHKLGHPLNPEFAIGAVDEDGQVFIDEHTALQEIPFKYLENERQIQVQTLRARRERYTPIREPIDPQGRIVIIVDDGIATGWTIKAAIQTLKDKKTKKIIVAIGVGSPTAVDEIKGLADEVVCVLTPTAFQAVGQFYREFPQVSDEDVVKILAGSDD